jgi:hypothetical protein
MQAVNRYSLDTHKTKVKRGSEAIKTEDPYILRRDINFNSNSIIGSE